jgi:hypothetical protein
MKGEKIMIGGEWMIKKRRRGQFFTLIGRERERGMLKERGVEDKREKI